MNRFLRRARIIGGLTVLGAFAAGMGVGSLRARRALDGTRVTITTTDRIPAELEHLDLSADQRTRLQAVLRRGADRVMRIMDDVDPRMRAALDSTDAEIRVMLSDRQRAAFDSTRRVNGPPLRRSRIGGPEGGAAPGGQ